jgi:uncharacterized repeat protein (TIGR01451 family)
MTDTPVPPTVTLTPTPTVTPTPTPGNVVVEKTVSPDTGGSGQAVEYTITIRNETGFPITLLEISDNMDSMQNFAGDTCNGPPNGSCSNQSGGGGGDWLWTGAAPLPNNGTTTMAIIGQFVAFPPDPGTSQSICNPGVIVRYRIDSISPTVLTATLGQSACFLLVQ